MSRRDEIVELLGGTTLFGGLTKKDLAKVVAAGKELTFRAGEELTEEGSSEGRCFVVLSGEVKVVREGRTKATLGPGKILGELALLDGGPRTATAIALTDVGTLSLSRWNFHPLLKEYPSIAEALLVMLCRRLREAERSVAH
jgi:CRP-like cAMP-binding protein